VESLILLKAAKSFLGVTTKTIQKWDKEGKIKIIRTIGGRRRVPLSEIERLQGIKSHNTQIIGYARVSSATQKDDLQTQVQFLTQRGITHILTDIGSGLSEKRRNYRKLIQLILTHQIQKLVVTYPDRLTRFGFATFQQFCASYGTHIEVLNDTLYKSPQEELVQDLITLIAHFSGKLYGLRSHKAKKVVSSVKSLVKEVETEEMK
jgi:putative resolvase